MPMSETAQTRCRVERSPLPRVTRDQNLKHAQPDPIVTSGVQYRPVATDTEDASWFRLPLLLLWRHSRLPYTYSPLLCMPEYPQTGGDFDMWVVDKHIFTYSLILQFAKPENQILKNVELVKRTPLKVVEDQTNTHIIEVNKVICEHFIRELRKTLLKENDFLKCILFYETVIIVKMICYTLS